ncbi:hypothetical protein [Massilia oculi]|uniref:hypothetical protein n=1 Tax=Massilia oculi TaxID=945844 RepID=UPI0028AFA198|nr:hypothetical protein [Massilia oculi]
MNNSIRALRQVAILWSVLGMCTSVMGMAVAQSMEELARKSVPELLQLYQKSPPGAMRNQDILITVLNKRLPVNESNFNIIRQSLAKSRVGEEKSTLISLLAALHVPRARSANNLLIERDIKALINSPDARVATTALFAYSRLVYAADRHQVLQRARSEQLISDDSYFAELAHGLRFAPADEQARMLAEMEGQKNALGAEILASTFDSPSTVGQLNSGTQKRLLTLLIAREPSFPMALDNFGLVDSIRYSYWINAVASIESGLTGRDYGDIVLNRLAAPATDPRKILAVFTNPEGKRLMQDTHEHERLAQLLVRAKAYADSLPQNGMLQDAVGVFAKDLQNRADETR